MSPSFRCAATSADLAEPLPGTASTVRPFLLLEVPGPWGVDAVRDSRLAPDVAERLARRCRQVGVRPLLIRRYGRTRETTARCFGAYAHPASPWVETTVLDRAEDVADLLDAPLEHLAAGRSLGLAEHRDPLFLVCTHGRHDACCAERGRPVAAALSTTHPEQTWETSHIGGDRFAGNLLVLPDGLYYGRADRDTAPRIAALHEKGHLDLEHLRGRAGFGFATQAAEWHLRRSLDVTETHRLRLVAHRTVDSVTEAVFAVDAGPRWRVRVGTDHGPSHRLTCQSERARRPVRLRLLGLEPA